MGYGTRYDGLTVSGATLHGFAQASINLNIVAGARAEGLTEDIDVLGWYPFERLLEIERMVEETYVDTAPIFERVGMEMMFSWYHYGPGKDLIHRGVDFLRFQSGSQGYASVIRGPRELVGTFELLELREDARIARIRSTTPFNKDLERGVIIGGMHAPRDLVYIDVRNDIDPTLFAVFF